jgi:leucyl aminopeptidase
MVSIKIAKSVPARAAVVLRVVAAEQLRLAGSDPKLLKRLGFDAAVDACVQLTGDTPAVTVLVGLGPLEEIDASVVRRATAIGVRSLLTHPSVVIDLSLLDAVGSGDGGADIEALIGAAVEGAGLAAYRFDRYKAASDKPVLDAITVVSASAGAKAAAARATVIIETQTLVRDLVNEPGGSMTPVAFCEAASAAAADAGVAVEIWDRKRLTKERCGGILGVARGSQQEPRLLIVRYTPKAPVASIALVGKGVTFDSGGLSIKPADAMMTMKCDMGGAATVLAATLAVARLGVNVAVMAYAPLTDNMLGADASRPGDVLVARNGTTIEVLNTDAEGRLILADALSIASAEKPDAVVDLATLTGACMVALGDKIAGLMGNDDGLLDQLQIASDEAGEDLWHLPLPAKYRKLLDSPVADLKNIGGRFGGTLTAGLFLQHFVAEDVAWAHIDIAGPAFSEEVDGEVGRGGTGFGLRTLVAWVEGLAAAGA